MKRYWPYDSTPLSIPGLTDFYTALSTVRKAFEKLDIVSKQGVVHRIFIDIRPLPPEQCDKPEHPGDVRWIRVFYRRFTENGFCDTETAVIDTQGEMPRLYVDRQPDLPGFAVHAAYQACCIALKFTDKRAFVPWSSTDSQEARVRQSAGILRKELRPKSFPYLDLVSVADGTASFVYWHECRLQQLLCSDGNSDLPVAMRAMKKILAGEYLDTAENEETDRVAEQAVEALKRLPVHPSRLCPVPYEEGLHGLARHGFPRIRFACVEPEAFLENFSPWMDFDRFSRVSRRMHDEAFGDPDPDIVLGSPPEVGWFRKNIRKNAELLSVDEDHFAQLLGMDVSCLCAEERQMLLTELLLAQALALLGIPVQAGTWNVERLYPLIYIRLSVFYCALRSHQYAESLFDIRPPAP